MERFHLQDFISGKWDFKILLVLRSSYKREMKIQGFNGKAKTRLSVPGLPHI